MKAENTFPTEYIAYIYQSGNKLGYGGGDGGSGYAEIQGINENGIQDHVQDGAGYEYAHGGFGGAFA